ncbi:MAG: 3-oxoacyl-[acyl-carrier-protein] reductase [Leptospiraceae bacterium]|nr:3-oxoacyl-[acyl-carrier-protein] reductase [Leptospiraceae bacterium]MDW8305512.1 3-oxoacyl-[acyl-carrier-protein] reductase [Leptospiraceae bacterium]
MFLNKTVVITGSARGIGRAIAEAFAEKQANVVISDIQVDLAQITAKEITQKYGVRAIAVACNVTQKEECHKLAEEALKQFGSLDIWVNNAGVIRDDLLLRMKEEDFDLVVSVNLKGVFNGMQAASRPMVKARSGKIINISSVAGLVGSPGQANYASAKAGVIAMTKTAARELAPRNITVNAVCPGYIQTDMTSALRAEIQEELKKQIPLPRQGTPQDIAYAVRFLASSEADFITGVILRVDGGMAIGL